MKKLLFVVSGALLLANVSSASVILTLVGGAPTAGPGSDYTWTYAVTLSTDENFRGGSTDFTEVIDFANYVSASWTSGALSSANAAISTQLTGPGNPPAGGTDSGSILNVVVKNTGSTILGSSVSGAVGDLGDLVITSTSGVIAMSGSQFSGSFSTQAQKSSDSSTTYNQGFLPTPATSAVPEPMPLSLVGAGLLGVGFLGRRRSKS